MHLQKSLNTIGLKILENKELDTIEKKDDFVKVTFKDKTHVQADVLLYALGRSANVEYLRIENLEISIDKFGYIPVNALFQVKRSDHITLCNIYAVGDVIGGSALTSDWQLEMLLVQKRTIFLISTQLVFIQFQKFLHVVILKINLKNLVLDMKLVELTITKLPKIKLLEMI